MLRVHVRLQTLYYMSERQVWIRTMQLVDVFSDVSAVGGWWCQERVLLFSSSPPAFLCGICTEKTGGTAFLQPLAPPCPPQLPPLMYEGGWSHALCARNSSRRCSLAYQVFRCINCFCVCVGACIIIERVVTARVLFFFMFCTRYIYDLV